MDAALPASAAAQDEVPVAEVDVWALTPASCRFLDHVLAIAAAERRGLRLERAVLLYEAIARLSLDARGGPTKKRSLVNTEERQAIDLHFAQAAQAAASALLDALKRAKAVDHDHNREADAAAAQLREAAESLQGCLTTAWREGRTPPPLEFPAMPSNSTPTGAAPEPPLRAELRAEALVGQADCCRLLGRAEQFIAAATELRALAKAGLSPTSTSSSSTTQPPPTPPPHGTAAPLALLELLDELFCGQIRASNEDAPSDGAVGARPPELSLICRTLVQSLSHSAPSCWRALGAAWPPLAHRASVLQNRRLSRTTMAGRATVVVGVPSPAVLRHLERIRLGTTDNPDNTGGEGAPCSMPDSMLSTAPGSPPGRRSGRGHPDNTGGEGALCSMPGSMLSTAAGSPPGKRPGSGRNSAPGSPSVSIRANSSRLSLSSRLGSGRGMTPQPQRRASLGSGAASRPLARPLNSGLRPDNATEAVALANATVTGATALSLSIYLSI